MSQQNGTEAAAALVGALEAFNLVDVLDLLARTGHTGELQVVGQGIDRRVWVDQGDLVDAAGQGSLQTSLFELACREEGWFYFTTAEKAPEGADRLSIASTLGELGPQVEEWKTLVAALPFESTVCMSSAPPDGDVQIRGDQWQLLSQIGNPGRTVREVVVGSSQDALVTLRTLQELSEAGLITVSEAPAGAPASVPPPTGGDPVAAQHTSDLPEPPLPPFEAPADGPPPAPPGFEAAEEPLAGGGVDEQSAVMPPPVTGDPWSSSVSGDKAGS